MKLFGKIGRRLLGWFLLIALIPLLFMGYQGYYFARKAVQREVFLHMQAVAVQKQGQIEQWFQERRDELMVLSANPQVISACADPNPARLHDLALVLESYRSREFKSFGVCSGTGEMLACTGVCDTSACRNIGQAARSAQESVFGPIHVAPGIGLSMKAAATVRDSSGRIVGVVISTLALEHTLNPIILDTTGLGRTGQAYLVDTDKVMLTPSRFMNHPAPLTHKMDSEGIRKALENSKLETRNSKIKMGGAAVYMGFEGQQVMGAWAYLPDQKWALLAEMDADEAFEPLAMLRRNTFLMALLMLGVIAVVVVFISRSLSDPIRKLAEASLDVSQGNLDRTVVVKLNDELGDLAVRFNSMVHSLKESQRQLVQSEKLAAIGELAASVVHEIRNPLSAIKMNLRILETKVESKDSSVAVHFQIAKQQTERLEIMLTELLDYAKPITLHRKKVLIGEFVQDVLHGFQSEADLGQVTLRSTLKNPGCEILLDPGKMQQVLWNLLLNAVQAVEPNSVIDLTCTEVHTGSTHQLEITITDKGKGIAEDNLKHIFEPFFTTRKQGTGLGLPNAKKIIEAHGGRIDVRSQVDQGTTAIVHLPMQG